jgi:Dehydrogenases with different specificities (related to short-chain alcohol dehydrogenases)
VTLGRPGQPEEIAPSFVFLASDDSSYTMGQILHPNGGTVVNVTRWFSPRGREFVESAVLPSEW